MSTRREEVVVTADVSNFSRNLAMAGAQTKKFANDLEQADSRMANIVQTGMAIAPAFTPIAAAAIPALAGLTTQLGFTVLAAGTTALAFQGVGGALKALNEFQVDPTTENFAKLKEELATLGPAGQEFVLFLQDLRPRMQELQNVAQEGLFPGMQEGLEDLFDLQPKLQRIISEIADTTGDLMAEAGDNLDDPKWRAFFDYLETDARPILSDTFRTFGNFTSGFAQLIRGLEPLTDDFSAGFLNMSRDFDDWATGLDQTNGYAEFVDYIRSTGPQVADTLGAVAGAVVEIVEATAPVGSVVLPALEGVADATAAIANSPAGPAIVGLAAAVGTLGRSMALMRAVGITKGENGKQGLIGSTLGLSNVSGAVTAIRTASRATDELNGTYRERGKLLAAGKASSAEYASVMTRQADAATKVADAEKARSAALRQGLSSAGRTAGLVAGLAVTASGAADGIGLTNTASLALMGTLAGPYGAALGAAVGFTMDLAAANNDVEDAMRSLKLASEDPYNLLGQREALAAADAAVMEHFTTIAKDGYLSLDPKVGLARMQEFFFGSGEAAAKSAAEIETANLVTEKSIRSLLTIAEGTGSDRFQIMPVEELADQAALVEAALTRAGLSIEDFDFDDPEGVRTMVDAIRDYVAATDSVPARSKAVGEALNELESEITPTATAAEGLKNAMDSLFGPGMNAAAANDAWIESLRTLQQELKAVPDLMANTQPALDNRALLRDSTQALQDRVAANAANDVDGDVLVRQLLRGRDAIIAQGKAAGIAGPQVSAYLRQLGLTPKNLTTIIQASGVLNARQKMEALMNIYKLTPREVKTLVKEAGADPTKAKIIALARQYDLTPNQVRTILTAVDNATKPTKKVQNELNETGRMNPKPTVTAVVGGAISAIQSVGRALAGINSKTVTVTTRYVKVGAEGKGSFADGGILGRDANGMHRYFAHGGITGRIGDQRPQIRPYSGPAGITWSEEGSGPWEAFISGHPGKRDRSRMIADDVITRLGGQAMWFANGGIAERAYAARPRTIVIPGPSAFRGPLEITGTLKTPWGPAEIRGLANAEARQVVRDERDHNDMLGRAR